jgi:hypothetical protein
MAKMAVLFKEEKNVRRVLEAKSGEHVVGVLISLEQQHRSE